MLFLSFLRRQESTLGLALRKSWIPAFAGMTWMLVVPLSAYAFSLQWPAACTDGVDCVVQNYADHNKGGAAQDFTCAGLTYPGHDGTDIRLRNLAAMRAGVAVLAPADGTVLRVRDGVIDQSIRNPGDSEAVVKQHVAALRGQDCGNGVVIQHAEGYETQLCHMRQGSIRVAQGQVVKAGDAIGMVGLSGNTEFPHVHLTVRKNGQVIDPYTAAPIANACGASATSLWATSHDYHATMLLNDGFADQLVTEATVRDTPVNLSTISANAPALVYWIDMMGLRAGDVLSLRITAPDGSTFVETSRTIAKPYALQFSVIGKRNHAAMAAGDYRAQITLTRAGDSKPLMEFSRTIEVR